MKLKPFMNIGPGQIISRYLSALNWTNKNLSDIIGMPENSVSRLIYNKQSITVDTAILLGKAFNTSPEFWLNLEQNKEQEIRVKKNVPEQLRVKLPKTLED